MQYFAGIDAIFVINLEERTDRRRHMERQFARLGLADDPRITFFPAIKPEDEGPCNSRGAHGVYLSNLELLGTLAAGHDRVLVLEDDCLFARRMKPDAFASDHDFIYGGVYYTEPTATKGPEEYGAHCIAYSRRVREPLVAYLKANYERGPGSAPYIAPVDGQFADFRRTHPEYTTQIHGFAHQMPSDSDITPQNGTLSEMGLVQRTIRALKTGYLYFR